jgi:uncharacterized protein (DUF433 family)
MPSGGIATEVGDESGDEKAALRTGLRAASLVPAEARGPLARAVEADYSQRMERRHPSLDRITFDPEKCTGKACIRGMRMTVEALVRYLAAGMSHDEILAEWPELEEEDIRQALAYAAWSVSDKVLDVA